jgi:3-methyladenine DNA glycosylase AlkD
MELNEAMSQLEALGSEQTRKTFLRHGVAEPLFGVKFGDLEKLRKKIKIDHTLAGQLWQTGNHDARNLACMVADAKSMTAQQLHEWAGQLKDAACADSLAALACRTPLAAEVRNQWLEQAPLRRAGWALVAHCAKDGTGVDEASALEYIGRIEATIHQAENWARRGMMVALISLAGTSAAARVAAEQAVARIGPVAFDPGNTACEFPDALPYIAKIWARKKV